MAASKAMQNPFEKEADDDKEEKSAPRGKSDEEVEVELAPAKGKDDDDDDDDDDAPEPDAAAVARRKERNRERGRRHKELLKRSEEIERRNAELEARLNHVQGYVQQNVQPQQQGDPVDAELNQLWTERRRLADEISALQAKGAYTKEMQDRDWQRVQEMEQRLGQLNYAKAQQSDPRNSPVYQHNQQVNQWLTSQHSDVMSHPRRDAIIQHAFGELYRLRAMGAAPYSFETYERALQASKQTFGLAKRPAPSEADRSRLAGIPRGGGAGSQGRTVTLSRGEQKLAWARFKGHPGVKNEQDAYRLYAQEVADDKSA